MEEYKGCKGCYWFELKVCHSLLPKDDKPNCYDTEEDIKKRREQPKPLPE